MQNFSEKPNPAHTPEPAPHYDHWAIFWTFLGGCYLGGGISVLIFLFITAVKLFLESRFADELYVLLLIPIGLFIPLAGLSFALNEKSEQLTAFRRGHHICTHCGYILYGLPENCCPECGHYFKVKPHIEVVIGKAEAVGPEQK